MDPTSAFLSLDCKGSGELALEGPKQLFELTGPALGPSQVVLRTYAVAFLPRDAAAAAAASAAAAAAPTLLPLTPCCSCVGRIVGAGAGPLTSLTGHPLRLGDYVYALRTQSGACASLVLCDAAHAGQLPLDVAALGPAERRARMLALAALPAPFFAACRALLALGLVPPPGAAPLPPPLPPPPGALLVLGAAESFVGWAAAELASSWGYKVLASAGSAAGVERLRRVCAEGGAMRHDLPGWVEAAVGLVCGKGQGVPRVLELGAAEGGLALACSILAPQGVIAVGRGAGSSSSSSSSSLDCAALAEKGGTCRGVALEAGSAEELRVCALAFHAAMQQQQQQQGHAVLLQEVLGLRAAAGSATLAAAAASTPLTGAVVIDLTS
jgi:NADPH:quinone reductase-like Zn-dependent oxidoreductase